MKLLILCSVLVCSAVSAGSVLSSPNNMSSPTAHYNSSVPPGLIPLEDGSERLDELNTAPTSIPDSTGLITTPDDNPIRQLQEDDLYDVNQLLEPERENSEEVNQSIEPKR